MTTLVHDLAVFIQMKHSEHPLTIVEEVARTTLKDHGFTREEIRHSKTRSFELQRLILKGQHDAEICAKYGAVIISDRSGVNPQVYTQALIGEAELQNLQSMEEWRVLKDRTQRSLLLVCEAGVKWLVDDGTRLMPKDNEEWMQFHKTFCAVLAEAKIEFVVVPNSINSREAVRGLDMRIGSGDGCKRETVLIRLPEVYKINANY